MLQKWEYRVVSLDDAAYTGSTYSGRIEKALNSVGDDGWELVGFTEAMANDGEDLLFMFKRPAGE